MLCKVEKKLYICGMNKDEYIKKCGCSTSEELSDEQILSFYAEWNDCIENALSAMSIIRGRVLGCDIDKVKGLFMLRQAFERNQVLDISYSNTMREGVVDNDGRSTFGGQARYEMKLRDKYKFEI